MSSVCKKLHVGCFSNIVGRYKVKKVSQWLHAGKLLLCFNINFSYNMLLHSLNNIFCLVLRVLLMQSPSSHFLLIQNMNRGELKRYKNIMNTFQCSLAGNFLQIIQCNKTDCKKQRKHFYIKTKRPVLCRQKEFVFSLGFFNLFCWPSLCS